MKRSTLLEIDGFANVALGLPLLAIPASVSDFLGLPASGATLYPVILGAVFIGIGVALLVERYRPSLSGLGLGGALAINLTFGLVLAAWLVFGRVRLPLRGALVLWALSGILVAIGSVELAALGRRGPKGTRE